MTSTGSLLPTHLTDKFAEPQQVSAAQKDRQQAHCPLPNRLCFIHELWHCPSPQALLLSWGSCTQPSAPPQMIWMRVTMFTSWPAALFSFHFTSDSPASSPAPCNPPRQSSPSAQPAAKNTLGATSPPSAVESDTLRTCGAFYATALLAQKLPFPSPSSSLSFLRFSALDLKKSPQSLWSSSAKCFLNSLYLAFNILFTFNLPSFMVSSILLIWRNLPFFFKYFCVGELPEFN